MDKEKWSKIYRQIMIVIITALLTFTITSVLMYKNGRIGYITVSKADTTGLGATLSSFRSLLKDRYLYDMDEKQMIEYAIKGYVAGVGDEYTEYFTKEEMEKFQTLTSGNYVGIGIYMQADTKNNVIKVSSPIKNGPAEKAGIKSGDIISKVNGKAYSIEELTQMSTDIKGKEGTTVELEIIREGQNLNFTIERKSVELYPIEGKILDNNIGYIQISSFDDGCAEQFKEAYQEIQNKEIRSLIIDLRDNGGGIVDEAMEIADYILDKDTTMLITVDKKQEEEVTKAKQEPIVKLPIVVLVNDGTASASEMLAGALQDTRKATIVGKTTYGKGVIQELYTLSDGSGLKITIKEYFTPNRNKINKVGIKPDYEVEYEKNKEDAQLNKAIEILKLSSQISL